MRSKEAYRAKIEWVKNDKNGKQFTKIKIDNRDVFVHIDKFQPRVSSFNAGDEIGFHIEDDIRGLQAVNIKIINKGSVTSSSNTVASSTHGFVSASPYDFCKRADKRIDNGELKQEPLQLHDRLNEGCFDIAFEIEWETLTPTAANPCVDLEAGASPEGCNKDEYAGYNKRWLIIGNRLAISPFTVKSAIANGFANIMGGCYRVVSSITGHDDVKENNYPYTGKYKRYRVSMDGKSHPGILKEVTKLENNDRKIKVQPVVEYYYDQEKPPDRISFEKNQPYYAEIEEIKNRKGEVIKRIVKKVIKQGTDKETKNKKNVFYFGKYQFGMNLTLGPGDLNKNHYHRFYSLNGPIKEAIIPAINFEQGKEFVYMGRFKKIHLTARYDPRTYSPDKTWDEELHTLELDNEDKWIYYEEFGNKITNIGKNFLFKAVFSVDDAIPYNNKVCNDPEELCPRCSMFGMTGKGEDEESPQGFKGRFKSATLISNKVLEPDKDTYKIPELEEVGNNYEVKREKDVSVHILKHNGIEVCRQYLLPLQGQPKANKRDVNGYYELDTGNIKGAKYYLHASCDIKKLIEDTDKKPKIDSRPPMPYTHHLRNFAVVCNEGEIFTGTVGAENCTPEEIAALIILLQSSEANHGFKIGLGKAFGMGSIKSSISRIWIRAKDGYEWQRFDDVHQFLEKNPDFKDKKDELKQILTLPDRLYNKLDGKGEDLTVPNIKTEYPEPGLRYWQKFNSRCLKPQK